MILILKTIGGLDIPLTNKKTLKLYGCGVINEVSETDYRSALKNAGFKNMLETGYIVVNSQAEDEALQDATDDVKNKQNEAHSFIQNSTNNVIVKE